jgi:hypothetical protein
VPFSVHLPRFELGTPSVSGRCANQTALQVPALLAYSLCLGNLVIVQASRPNEVETGFEPVYTALQAVASPLGHSTVEP